MLMPARSCFPVPEGVDDVAAALLEPLGVALHAVDLAHLRVARSAAILGAGPIGLLLLQVARLAGAEPVFVSDPLPWRLRQAERWGGVPLPGTGPEVLAALCRETHGRGVEVAFEAAGGGPTIELAAEMACLGGRVVLVGIPSDDRLSLKHSTARRKGLSLVLSRRMKHVYPRALRLAQRGRVDLHGLVTHRFPLARAAEAFALNAAYQDNVVKVIVES
jgi:L-iditol 2-dehydrogenase